MRQPLDHTRHSILSTTIFRRHLVADIHNILPVLGGEILVGRLGCDGSGSVASLQAGNTELSKLRNLL